MDLRRPTLKRGSIRTLQHHLAITPQNGVLPEAAFAIQFLPNCSLQSALNAAEEVALVDRHWLCSSSS